MPQIDMELQALEEAIRLEFIPSLTGENHLSCELRNLLALPARTGGLGLNNPVREAVIQFHTSVKVTAPLVKLCSSTESTQPKLWQSSQRSRAKYAKRNKVSLH